MDIVAILTLLLQQNPTVLLSGSVLLSVIYTIWSNINNPKMYDERVKIYQKHRTTLTSYIRDSLMYLHITAVSAAREIVLSEPIPDGEKEDDVVKERTTQLSLFDSRSEKILFRYIREVIEAAIAENGYHLFDEKKLDGYKNDKGGLIHKMIILKVGDFSWEYECVAKVLEDVFSEEETVKVFSDIISKTMELDSQEKKDIDELKSKFSIWRWFKKPQ